MNIFKAIFFYFLSFIVVADTYTIRQTSSTESMYFGSDIEPFKKITISSPMDGVILTKTFEYGQFVEKGQVLFTIESSSLAQKFHSTLNSYLEAKEKYTKSNVKLEESKDLLNIGMMSKIDYDSDKSSNQHDYLNLLEHKYKLIEDLKFEGKEDKFSIYENLSFSDIEDLESIIKTRHNILEVKATDSGLALSPDAGKNNKSEGFIIGDGVEKNIPLVTIGDTTRFNININVNEMEVGKIKIGQEALITGYAFPSIFIPAYVVHVDLQGNSTSGRGSPLFKVKLHTDLIDQLYLDTIKMGMTAKIKLDIVTEDVVMIPIKFVLQDEDDNTYVLKKSKDDKLEKVYIETGRTSLDSVEVVSGLKDGDEIVTQDPVK